MKITKYLHSCLLVENEDKTILIDPGIFTAMAKALDVNSINRLDYLLFTHEHPDHMHLPLVHELVANFPDVKIITNPSIVEILKKENIKATAEGDETVQLDVVMHEQLWDKEPPQNAIYTVFGRLTHPGDAMSFTKSAEILALPVTAPWGSTSQAVNKALEVGPKTIIPIHDFMWKDDFRKNLYQRLHEFFKEKGIDFRSVETGEPIEV